MAGGDGQGERNGQGDKLIVQAESHDMIIAYAVRLSARLMQDVWKLRWRSGWNARLPSRRHNLVVYSIPSHVSAWH